MHTRETIFRIPVLCLALAGLGCGSKPVVPIVEEPKPPETGIKLLVTIGVSSPPNRAVFFANDNQTIAMDTSAPDLIGVIKPVIKIIDPFSPKAIITWPRPNSSLDMQVFSPDDRTIVMRTPDGVQFRRPTSGELVKTLTEQNLSRLANGHSAFSRDMSLFAQSDDKSAEGRTLYRVFVWDFAKESVQAVSDWRSSRIDALVFSKDGKRLTAAGGNDVQIYDVADMKGVASFSMNGGRQPAVLSADGKTLAWVDDEQKAWTADLSKVAERTANLDGVAKPIAEGTKTVRILGLSPDGSTIVTIDELPQVSEDFKSTDCRLRYRDTSTGAIQAYLDLPLFMNIDYLKAVLSPDGRRLLIWDWKEHRDSSKQPVVVLYERAGVMQGEPPPRRVGKY